MTDKLVEFHRFKVTVEVPVPREDWLVRLHEGVDGCVQCGGLLPDTPIYLNTEGPGGEASDSDLLCSWICLLELAAAVVAVADNPERTLVSVEEIDDWRNREEQT